MPVRAGRHLQPDSDDNKCRARALGPGLPPAAAL